MSNETAPRTHETVQAVSPDEMLTTLRNLDHEVTELDKNFLTSGLSRSDYENKLLVLRKRHRDILSLLTESLKVDAEQARQLHFRLYSDRTVQLLLTGFIGGMVKELEPNFDSDRKARYPILDHIDQTTATINPSELLDELVYAGVLKKKMYERFLRCPKCGSHSAVYLRLKCPECGSLQLESSKLVEHLVCGAVHEFEEFATADQITCPSCKEPLVKEGEDFRVVGTFSRCESCRVHFDRPSEKFACRVCQDEFEIRDAAYYDTYTYTLNAGVLAEVKGIIGLPVFKTALEDIGFKVELPGTMSGASGMIHNFTLAGTQNDRTIVTDVVEAELEVDEKEVLAFYTKVRDLRSTLGILVAIPHLSPRAKEFATKAFSAEDLTYVEAANTAEALERFKGKLNGFG
jgi:hypothetical protein